MRLTKVQKKLREKNIPFSYEERRGIGEVTFQLGTQRAFISEIVGTNGKTPTGLYTNLFNYGEIRFKPQTVACELLDKLDDYK